MNKSQLRYAHRIARDCKKKKPMDMKQAKLIVLLADIREIMRVKE